VPITSGGMELKAPVRQWECPNCGLTDVTREHEPHTRMHACPKMGGLTAPMVLAGTKCKIEAKEREDYIGNENVTYNEDGRPVMAIETTREDGNDVVVFAPCAESDGKADL
jgi:hypothetical protein